MVYVAALRTFDLANMLCWYKTKEAPCNYCKVSSSTFDMHVQHVDNLIGLETDRVIHSLRKLLVAGNIAVAFIQHELWALLDLDLWLSFVFRSSFHLNCNGYRFETWNSVSPL